MVLLVDLTTELSDYTTADVAILSSVVSGIVFFIQQIFRFLAKGVEKRIEMALQYKKAQIEAKTKKERAEFDAEIKLIEKAAEQRMVDTTLNDALSVLRTLREIQHKYNAKRVIIFMYHNGVARGFRNFSARYEAARTFEDEIMDMHQSKPLATFYEAIQDFKKVDWLIYDSKEPLTNKNNHVVKRLRYNQDKVSIIFPLLVHETIDIPQHHKIMSIRKNGDYYYIIGTMVVTLDDESEDCDDVDKNALVGYADDIVNMYEGNYKIIG